MKNLTIPFLFILLVQFGFSQQVKFGKIEKDVLSQEKHQLDPDADAAILYEKRTTYFDYNDDDGWLVMTKIHRRVKIFTTEGLDKGTYKYWLAKSGSSDEKMIAIKGYTFNLIDGKIEKTKLKKDGIFKEEVSKYRNKSSITMPNVKVGSVLDMQFTIVSPFYAIDDVVMQYDIPVDRIEAKVDIPKYFIFKRFQKGYYPAKFEETRENRKIQVRWREKTGSVTTKARISDWEFSENVYKISAVNVPAMKTEVFVSNINNYRTAFLFEIAQYRPENGLHKSFATNWDAVTKSIYEVSNFGLELKKEGYFKNDIDELLKGVSSKEEKAVAIFEFVKNKMNWDGYQGKYCDKGVRKAYKEQTGNVAEINLMLTAMLRYAGVNANPVLVSTRSNGIPLFPTRDGFNYVIAAVEVEDAVILLDATVKSAVPNVLPSKVLNWNGRLVRKGGSSTEVPLVPNVLSKEIISLNATILEDGALDAKVRFQYTNNNALSFRERNKNVEEESYLQGLETTYDGIEISEYKTQNLKKVYKPVVESYSFEKESAIEVIGDKIFFSPMLIFTKTENPLKLEKREYPVDYGFPRETKYRVSIKIPEGYKVETMPENAAIQLPDNLGVFKYALKDNGNMIQLVCSESISSAIVPSAYYDVLKEYYKQMIAKQTEKVVLSKI